MISKRIKKSVSISDSFVHYIVVYIAFTCMSAPLIAALILCVSQSVYHVTSRMAEGHSRLEIVGKNLCHYGFLQFVQDVEVRYNVLRGEEIKTVVTYSQT